MNPRCENDAFLLAVILDVSKGPASKPFERGAGLDKVIYVVLDELLYVFRYRSVQKFLNPLVALLVTLLGQLTSVGVLAPVAATENARQLLDPELLCVVKVRLNALSYGQEWNRVPSQGGAEHAQAEKRLVRLVLCQAFDTRLHLSVGGRNSMGEPNLVT